MYKIRKMDDEKEIIYIALSNSINMLKDSLEEDNLDKNDRELTQYLIDRHLSILDKYAEEITQEKPIKRPIWKDP